jgi:hypothetical protein
MPATEGAPKTTGAPAPIFKSSIRTMQEDVAALKKGQPPVGFQMEKQSERDEKPTAEASGPKMTPPPLRPAPQVKLGELEKSRPLPGGMRPLPVPPPVPMAKPLSPMKTGLAIPTTGKANWKRLIFLVGGLVIVTFLVWFFALRGPSAPEATVSPTPTFTATPTPPENSYFIINSTSIALGTGFITRFDSSINKEPLISSREPALYKILNPATGNGYTLSEFLGGLLVQAPAELLAAAKSNFYMTAFYKSDNVDGYGLIVELNDSAAALTAMGNWESTITQGLKDVFLLNPANSISATFLDNTYRGAVIRFRNFPNPNLTIDYAVVTAINGESYLIITNSREHMYAIIDKIK